MNSFLHFNETYQLVKKINNIIGPYHEDHVSYLYSKSGQTISVNSNLNKNNFIEGKTNALLKINGFDITLNFSSLPSFYFEIGKEIIKKSLSVKATMSSKKYSYPHISPSHSKNCITSFSSTFRTGEYEIEGFFGVKNNSSLSTMCLISNNLLSTGIRTCITEKINILEASFLSKKYGPFASIKGDISSFSLKKMKIGCFKTLNNIQLYGLIELFNRSFNFGLFSHSPKNNLVFAIEGGYNYSKHLPKFATGFQIDRKNTFCGKINIGGTIEMMTKFSPTQLVTVTLRSETSVKDKFETLNFGWSLDFQ